MIELLVAMGVTIVVVGGAVLLFSSSSETSSRTLRYSEVQTEARAALSQMTRDFSQAGTGVPLNGIPIPSVTSGGANPNFACDASQCYTGANGSYTQGLLYKVTPGNNIGPQTSELTDAIKIVYVDPELNWSALSSSHHRAGREQSYHARGDHPGSYGSGSRDYARRRHPAAEYPRLCHRSRYRRRRQHHHFWP